MRTSSTLLLIAALASPALAQESPVPYETTEANCRRAAAESATERATRIVHQGRLPDLNSAMASGICSRPGTAREFLRPALEVGPVQ